MPMEKAYGVKEKRVPSPGILFWQMCGENGSEVGKNELRSQAVLQKESGGAWIQEPVAAG